MHTESQVSRNIPGVSRARQRYHGLPSYRHGVRYYDASLGRFISADRLFIERPELCVERTLECGLYGYAMNNPVKHTDPNGEAVPLILGASALIGAAVSGGITAYQEWDNSSGGEFAAKVTASVLSGGVKGLAAAGAALSGGGGAALASYGMVALRANTAEQAVHSIASGKTSAKEMFVNVPLKAGIATTFDLFGGAAGGQISAVAAGASSSVRKAIISDNALSAGAEGIKQGLHKAYESLKEFSKSTSTFDESREKDRIIIQGL